MSSGQIKALFLDLGGVFLTNGWDRHARMLSAERFGLDFTELNERHRIIFDAYESGKMSLQEYVDLLVFYEPRPFSPDEYMAFMYEQSEAYQDMIALVTELKQRYQLRTIAVNNEGRELNEYRISQFGLKSFIDVFASSCFVKTRKPDKDIYQIALDLAQVKPEEVAYLDDRKVFIEAAERLGINGVHHQSIDNTRERLAQLGLVAAAQ
ncbi:HAD family phosphatase [Mucilaginibacter sp. Bleaf8]|uniref:HAD family hydrolase n=1 Tax=Mucilaginibacter sp. Bleaf8 TaxID=2834430 RepID=UPI001BCFD621|nr:HAD family phosphatase [Mucilaginibacter sp. Bleaf8]MBS7563941.1 HAD family phosphatase [Mucilaginibacter sp. Bleaf8]